MKVVRGFHNTHQKKKKEQSALDAMNVQHPLKPRKGKSPKGVKITLSYSRRLQDTAKQKETINY